MAVHGWTEIACAKFDRYESRFATITRSWVDGIVGASEECADLRKFTTLEIGQ
jgi:hypothetical protein